MGYQRRVHGESQLGTPWVMGVVECEQQEVVQEDVILIQEEEGNNELKKKTLFCTFTELSWILLYAGVFTFLSTVITWIVHGLMDLEREHGSCLNCGVMHDIFLFWVLVSLLMIFHGLIGVNKPPESYNLEAIINEKQFSCKLPLRHVLGATVNTVIGIAGAISIPIVLNPWNPPTWKILWLILSSLLLLWVLITSFMIYFKQKSGMQLQNSESPGEEPQ